MARNLGGDLGLLPGHAGEHVEARLATVAVPEANVVLGLADYPSATAERPVRGVPETDGFQWCRRTGRGIRSLRTGASYPVAQAGLKMSVTEDCDRGNGGQGIPTSQSRTLRVSVVT